MNFVRTKELIEEKVKFFTKRYLGIRLDYVTVIVVGILLFAILTILIFDIVNF